MENSKNNSPKSSYPTEAPQKKDYVFGGIEEFSLEKIEETILEESIYLDVFAGSDINFKENIEPLNNVLPSLMNLNCISYNYKVENYPHKDFPKTKQLGVVAQELKSVFPELVRTDAHGDLEVNYTQLTTITLQAIKELSQKLEESNKRIIALENQIQNLKN